MDLVGTGCHDSPLATQRRHTVAICLPTYRPLLLSVDYCVQHPLDLTGSRTSRQALGGRGEWGVERRHDADGRVRAAARMQLKAQLLQAQPLAAFDAR